MRRYVPQDFGVEVSLTTEGVSDDAFGVHRHGIDGEVAAFEIFLKRNGRVCVDCEAVVTRPRFALGARQRIFLFGVGVQENGEVPANLRVTRGRHLLGCAADYDPVDFLVRIAQQGVADGAANAEAVHIAYDQRLRMICRIIPCKVKRNQWELSLRAAMCGKPRCLITEHPTATSGGLHGRKSQQPREGPLA